MLVQICVSIQVLFCCTWQNSSPKAKKINWQIKQHFHQWLTETGNFRKNSLLTPSLNRPQMDRTKFGDTFGGFTLLKLRYFTYTSCTFHPRTLCTKQAFQCGQAVIPAEDHFPEVSLIQTAQNFWLPKSNNKSCLSWETLHILVMESRAIGNPC